MADEQDLQWNAGKMSIASADGIASRGERMSWTFSVEINNADLCNHMKEESHIDQSMLNTQDKKQVVNKMAALVYIKRIFFL